MSKKWAKNLMRKKNDKGGKRETYRITVWHGQTHSLLASAHLLHGTMSVLERRAG